MLQFFCTGLVLKVPPRWYRSDRWIATCVLDPRREAKASVKHLVLFHHDPDHSDEQLEAILERAQREFPSTSLAREGEVVEI